MSRFKIHRINEPRPQYKLRLMMAQVEETFEALGLFFHVLACHENHECADGSTQCHCVFGDTHNLAKGSCIQKIFW